MKAIDVSNYQPRDLEQLGTLFDEADTVIVRLAMPWEKIDPAHHEAQIASAKAVGKRVEGYVWAYGSVDGRRTWEEAVAVCAALNVDFLWVDMEDTAGAPNDAWLHDFVGDSKNIGVYTARGWWTAHMHEDWSELPLWDAHYDNVADVDAGFAPYGGWTQAQGKQYTSTPIDQSIFREVEEQMQNIPTSLDKVWEVAVQLRQWGHDLGNADLTTQAEKLEAAVVAVKTVIQRDPSTP